MRIRTIKPEFWSHPIMAKQSDATKLLAIGLLNLADDDGYFFAEPKLVRNAIRPFDDDSGITTVSLRELSELGYISIRKHPTHGDIGRVESFINHQVINKPKPSIIKALHDSGIDTVAIPYQDGLEGKGMEQGKERNAGGQTDGLTPSKKSEWNPTPEQITISEWFDRRASTKWSEKEIKAYKAIPHQTLLDGIEDMNDYYRSDYPYLRKDVLTLLNHWVGEMDRAMKWQSEPKNKAESRDTCKPL
jgi:hypothetical protein